MFKRGLSTVFVLFVGAIVGVVTGFVTSTIIGFVDNTIWEGVVDHNPFLNDLYSLLISAIIFFGPFGIVNGFITGLGVALMGSRSRPKLTWPLITVTGILLGGWISKDEWLYPNRVQGTTWYYLVFIAIHGAMAAWLVVHLVERILGKRLNRGGFTPWVIGGYSVALAFITVVTSRLIVFVIDSFASW